MAERYPHHDQIIDQYRKGGKQCRDIAKDLDIGLSLVYRVLRRDGIDVDGEQAKRRQEAAEEFSKKVVDRYEAGCTSTQLAAELGVTPHTVLTALRKNGVKIRPRNQGPSRNWTEAEVDEIVALREKGLSQQAIAEKFHTTQTRVSSLLRSRGFRSAYSWKNREPIAAPNDYLMVKLYADEPEDAPFVPMAWGTGYILQHRIVMARHLGRLLLEHETVHHINGDRKDNRIENLQLRQGKHGKHSRFKCGDCGSHNIVTVPLAEQEERE